MIKIKLTLLGSAPTNDIIGVQMNLPVPLIIGNRIRHENNNMHLDYVVRQTQYVVDECGEGEFYQSASVAIESDGTST